VVSTSKSDQGRLARGFHTHRSKKRPQQILIDLPNFCQLIDQYKFAVFGESEGLILSSRILPIVHNDPCTYRSPAIHEPPEMQSKRFRLLSRKASHFDNA
jgi:hypothetical protein